MIRIAPLISTQLATSPGPYVLLVDDHEPTLRRLHAVVTSAGHRCVSTSSPSEAVRLCDARRPQVVVTDFTMPNLDGGGLAHWLSSRFPSIPIVLVSGEEFDGRSRRVMEQTFSAILTKPIDVERFLRLLERMMPPGGKPTHGSGRP